MHIQRTESASIVRELDQINDAISERAHELYEQTGQPSVLDNWRQAEQELVRHAMVELREEGADVEVLVGMEHIDSEDIEVHIAARDLLIRARREHVVEVVHLSGAIDPDSVDADFRDGRLRLRMSVSEETSEVLGASHDLERQARNRTERRRAVPARQSAGFSKRSGGPGNETGGSDALA